MNLEELRAAIDDLDAQMLALLNQRAECVLEVAALKQAGNHAQFVPAREREIFDRLRALNSGPLPEIAVTAIYREIIAAMRAMEKPLAVAYLGPPGTFAHLASLRKFGPLADYRPQDGIAQVFTEVEHQRAQYGVVPIENSSEGIEYHTLDQFSHSNLHICAEIFVDVEQTLLSRVDLGEIRTIYSHPLAPGQCRDWLKAHLPGVEVVDVASTARAAQRAADDPTGAAIGSRLAADIYGLRVIAEQIQDLAVNRTRFLVIGPTENEPSGRDKTSIMFSVAHRPGSLFRVLGILEEHEINMTLIESRPSRQTPWEYVFYIDCQGHITEPRLTAAMEGVQRESIFLRVLGSYPEAE